MAINLRLYHKDRNLYRGPVAAQIKQYTFVSWQPSTHTNPLEEEFIRALGVFPDRKVPQISKHSSQQTWFEVTYL